MADNPVPLILLTRPRSRSDAFAATLRETFGGSVEILIAPLMELEWRVPDELPAGETLIFTSPAGVEGLSHVWSGLAEAHCVGDTTARAAREAGHHVISVALDAAEMVMSLSRQKPGDIYHARGVHGRGDVAEKLRAAGYRAREGIVYDQIARPMPDAVRHRLSGHPKAVAPIFSPRSAVLLTDALRAEATRLLPVCLSPAVAAALPSDMQGRAVVAESPDTGSLVLALDRAISRLSAA